MTPNDFPLTWPEGRARTADRVPGRFKLQFEDAYDGLVTEAEKLHDDPAHDVIISTNMPLDNTGMPIVSERRIGDPGVCVYLSVKGKTYAIASDIYLDVHHNLRAIAVTIAALRTIQRHGTGALTAQALSGFAEELPGRPDMPQLVAASG